MAPHTLVARLDSAGDMLLQGPAIRAVATGSSRVTLLAGPRGEAAARLLPGVDEIIVFPAPWIDAEPLRVSPAAHLDLVARITSLRVDTSVIFTSFHQSPLPLALLLRLAGVARIGAISVDYPGSLLDVRHLVDEDLHEVERSLSLAHAMGFKLPPSDDGALGVRLPLPPPELLRGLDRFVVVHPGTSAPARAWPAGHHRQLVQLLDEAGWTVVVTGSPDERVLTAQVAGNAGIDVGGRLDFAELAALLARAEVVVVGNTGPAHLTAAVGTPVVSLFAPVVPACRWRPWRVPHVLLGEQATDCAGSRARVCPVPGHPCLTSVKPLDVAAAVASLSGQERKVAVSGVSAG
ncbi:MAG: glycosyltransferase family 9 protein [Candidatus Dormibacteraeota bacterium]|uniref:Glycosyltransferase family 9 protein n=1 Tax=Candidatus Dormiibacter inghamiae TaxID=3127013 RepID=A0A934KJK7_9BACT|nr:glycosyltransferase family 9 protein [Candidatus Dormibacteraeota bacterium]MBJ7604753.1 glycosyltransferase family 9 protein [Candidatus Dormibacteraeota bacterium]